MSKTIFDTHKTEIPTLQLTEKEKTLIRFENLSSIYQKTDKVKAILEGRSKRKTGFTQDEVATLFSFGYDGYKSSTGNFRSQDGILWHYDTIEAIRLSQTDEIVQSRDCWSAGFAHCSHPPNRAFSLNLSMLENAIGRHDITEIEVLEVTETNRKYRTDALIRYKDRQFLNAFDDNGAFLTELEPDITTIHHKDGSTTKRFNITTVKAAFESLKPKIVKLAEKSGIDVRRQGEFFFIPTQLKTISNVQKRTNEPCKRVIFQCTECGLKKRPKFNIVYSIKDGIPLNEYGREIEEYHPSESYFGIPPTWTEKQKECAHKHRWYDKSTMQPIIYNGRRFSEYPRITLRQQQPLRGITQLGDELRRTFRSRTTETNHSATRLATATEQIRNATFSYTVVKGVIRHPEHRSLNLGNQWHIIANNRQIRSYNIRNTRIGAD